MIHHVAPRVADITHYLLAPEQGQDGDDVTRQAAHQEHHAAREGGVKHPVGIILTDTRIIVHDFHSQIDST